MKISQRMVNGWEKKLDVAIATGKGKFSRCMVCDIHDYRKVIKLIRSGELLKAYVFASSLDTASHEEIPMTIWNILEKEYYK